MKKNIKNLIYTSAIFVYFGFFKTALAIDYVLLERLPGIGDTEGKVTNFGTYLSDLFTLSIGLAAILAVLMLSVAGFKYITVESFTGKGDAKNMIQNAVFGLILILSAYLLLQTVNPELVEKEYDIPDVSDVTGEDIGIDSEHTEESVFVPYDPESTTPEDFSEALSEEGDSSDLDSFHLPTGCVSTITGLSIPCSPTTIQESSDNDRPLGNFESFGYTKTKILDFVDMYEKDDDIFCLNSFTGLETDCP